MQSLSLVLFCVGVWVVQEQSTAAAAEPALASVWKTKERTGKGKGKRKVKPAHKISKLPIRMEVRGCVESAHMCGNTQQGKRGLKENKGADESQLLFLHVAMQETMHQ